MYRWHIRLIRQARGAVEETESLRVEVPSRGAAFMLPRLMHLGHPVHLALLDAYLRGCVPFPAGAGLGRDSRAVLASLVGPLLLLHVIGREQASLADLVLLPPARVAVGHSRFVILNDEHQELRLACASARSPRASYVEGTAGAGAGWHHAISVLPGPGDPGEGEADVSPVAVVLREATGAQRDDGDKPSEEGMPPTPAETSCSPSGAAPGELAETARSLTRDSERHDGPPTTAVWQGIPISLSMRRGRGHRPSLALAADPGLPPASTLLPMEAAAWATLEALLGTQLVERRSEPMTLRLVGAGRTTELAIGHSLVLPRNQRVFAAWLGSDGRVLIRLAGDPLQMSG